MPRPPASAATAAGLIVLVAGLRFTHSTSWIRVLAEISSPNRDARASAVEAEISSIIVAAPCSEAAGTQSRTASRCSMSMSIDDEGREHNHSISSREA